MKNLSIKSLQKLLTHRAFDWYLVNISNQLKDLNKTSYFSSYDIINCIMIMVNVIFLHQMVFNVRVIGCVICIVMH